MASHTALVSARHSGILARARTRADKPRCSAAPDPAVVFLDRLDQFRFVHRRPAADVKPASDVEQMFLAGVGVDALGRRDRVAELLRQPVIRPSAIICRMVLVVTFKYAVAPGTLAQRRTAGLPAWVVGRRRA